MGKEFAEKTEPNYPLEELLPLLSRLAEKYTIFESSSITNECAQTLMEAILYCIQEYKDSIEMGSEILERDDFSKTDTNIQKTEKIPAADAYQRGYELVIQKAKAANQLYNKIMENFSDYGSLALYDTMIEEMPKFFLHYDARFAPHKDHLLLAYPVIKPLGKISGIDRVYQYLCYIQKEQEFLRKFPEGYVQEICKAYHEEYEELFISLTEIIMMEP